MPGNNPRDFATLVVLIVLLLAVRMLAPSDVYDNAQPGPMAHTIDVAVNGQWLMQREPSGELATKPPMYPWLAAMGVIATGLTDPDRIRRERPEMPADNVTPLRPPLREEASPETLMNATLPAEMEPGVRPAGVREEEFMSPFNDELDVPAFIRRKNSQNEVV